MGEEINRTSGSITGVGRFVTFASRPTAPVINTITNTTGTSVAMVLIETKPRTTSPPTPRNALG